MCGLVGKNVSKGRFMFFSVVCRLNFFQNISAYVVRKDLLLYLLASIVTVDALQVQHTKKRCTLVNEKKLGKLKLGVLEVMCENLSIPVTPDQRRK